MSLGDHLDELRYRLMMAIGGLIVGLVICLFFGQFLMRIIVVPYESAMKSAGLAPSLLAIVPSEQFIVYVKTCPTPPVARIVTLATKVLMVFVLVSSIYVPKCIMAV